MIDTVVSVAGAISWSWIGATILLALAGGILIYMGLRQLGIYCLIAAAFCGWSGGLITKASLAEAALERAEAREAAAKADAATQRARYQAQTTQLKKMAAQAAARDAAALEALVKAQDIAKTLTAEIDRLKTLPADATCEQAIKFVKEGWK